MHIFLALSLCRSYCGNRHSGVAATADANDDDDDKDMGSMYAGVQVYLCGLLWTIRLQCSMPACCTVCRCRLATVCVTSTLRMSSPFCVFAPKRTRSWSPQVISRPVLFKFILLLWHGYATCYLANLARHAVHPDVHAHAVQFCVK